MTLEEEWSISDSLANSWGFQDRPDHSMLPVLSNLSARWVILDRQVDALGLGGCVADQVGVQWSCIRNSC